MPSTNYPIHALIVDDEPLVVQTSTEALLYSGYIATFALGAAEALQYIDSARPLDILITDVVMPQIDGFKLAQIAIDRRPGLHVLYTTGYVGLARELSSIGEWQNQILHKPYRPVELIHNVRRILEAA